MGDQFLSLKTWIDTFDKIAYRVKRFGDDCGPMCGPLSGPCGTTNDWVSYQKIPAESRSDIHKTHRLPLAGARR
ncbi:unnamed protein product [Sphenostylis stenocarpa]|uniref:Uncharacterized protein n=1 Tax=Sphenostylis stenocarpa TaxID=92480 RepID=A0AA86SU92_9FABA|nr:unnamed protein product [Sphenostylis stenocarpa]